LTSVDFLERKYAYGKALVKFADCLDVESADGAVADQVKAHKLDAYRTLDKFVAYLIGHAPAPKTVTTT
jgi:hypothetical protein